MPYGAQLKFGIARQASAGSGGAVTVGNSYFSIPLLSHDVGLEKQEVISQNLNGTFEQGASYDGTANIMGTIEVEATPKALGALLTATLGTPTSAGVGSAFTAAFLPRTADFSSNLVNNPYTIYAQFADSTSAELYFDCQFGQIEFQFGQGQLLRTRAMVAGGQRVTGGTGSAGLPIDTQDLSMGWLWDVSSISFGGGAVQNMSDISVSINENIQPVYTLNGSLLPYKYTRTGFREVTVNGTMMFDSRSMYNDFVSGTQRRLLITAKNTRSVISVQSENPTLVIDVPQLKITAMKPSVSGPGEVSVNFTGRGLLDPTSRYTVKVNLTNTYAPLLY